MRILPDAPEAGTVFLKNIGCKVNRYEGECLLNFYSSFGLKPGGRNPDLVIINTCVVTKTAEAKSRKAINKLQKRFPKAQIIVTGCLEYYKSLKTKHYWLSMNQKSQITNRYFPLTNRSRYYLMIEDGCDRNCYYCIIPKIRGKSKSKPIKRIIDEIKYAKDLGFGEIVLVGVNIGLYELGLPMLLRRISKIKNLPRIRISSLEPEFLNADLISALKDIPFCRHLHIALEHVDDNVLHSMGRRKIGNIADLIDRLKTEFPAINLGSDIIVGYPTESQTEYENLVSFIEENPIDYLHVFPFSKRPGTKAALMREDIKFPQKKIRVDRLRALSAEKQLDFMGRFVGHNLEVIVEKKNGTVFGLSDNYLRLKLNRTPSSNITLVKIKKISNNQILAEPV